VADNNINHGGIVQEDTMSVIVALWLKSDDPQQLHDDLAPAGVPITAEPFDSPFGRTFSFADPDGYVHG
jgi:predicted enzyme related to lactoylglutathione lyase